MAIRARQLYRLNEIPLTVADIAFGEQTVTRMIVTLLNVGKDQANAIMVGFRHAYTGQDSRWEWYERESDPNHRTLGAYYLLGFEAGMKASLDRRDTECPVKR